MELSKRTEKNGAPVAPPASSFPAITSHHRFAQLNSVIDPPFSVRDQFAGTSVLLTGATGFVGSVVLEQLLRTCPGIDTIFVLCRDKKGSSAGHRIRRLLHSGLFHYIRDKPHLRAKVCLVQGDLRNIELGTLPTSSSPHQQQAPHQAGSQQQQSNDDHRSCSSSNGTAPDDPAHTESGVGDGSGGMWDATGLHIRQGTMSDIAASSRLLVIHCAARIALEDPLQVTLAHNYYGMKHLLQTVSSLPGLAGIVHVSTAFVNCCKPFLPEGIAEEQIYPLKFGDREVDHGQVVADLMKLEGYAAEARASYLADLWGFPNSYVLGKNLTERLLRDAHCRPAPVSIVRPTLVSALAGPPYPGFTGNLAGPSGYAIAFAMGFFSEDSPCWSAYNHLDNVPADCVSSCIIGAAAVLLAGVDVTCMSMPRSDTCLEGSAVDAAEATPHNKPLAGSTKTGEQRVTYASVAARGVAVGGGGGGGGTEAAEPPRPTKPASEAAMGDDANIQPVEPASASAVGSSAGAGTEAAEPSQAAKTASEPETVRHAAKMRRQAIDGTGEGWDDAVSSKDELQIQEVASISNGFSDQRQPPLTVFQCGSTCMQPLSHAESYALAYEFYSKNRAKARIMLGDYVKYKSDYKPVLWKSRIAKRWTHIKIGTLALLLSCFGMDKQAKRLRGGYTMWDQTLTPKNDFRLSFSVKNALALEALMSPEERTLFPLVWRGEWLPFMATYMAAVMRLFLKQEVPQWRKGRQVHSFVYIPNTHVV